MRVGQQIWSSDSGWVVSRGDPDSQAHLVLLFGERRLLDAKLWEHARRAWPRAEIVTCSTAGEIAGTRVLDDGIVATTLQFASSRVVTSLITLKEAGTSRAAGEILASRLAQPGLRHVFVLSDGLQVNGSELVHGLTSSLPAGVAVTGGLSGDGTRFEHTLVNLNVPSDEPSVVAIGFYGEGLQIGFGSLGGWDPFGPHRQVTRSDGNVLFEIDGQPALDLYKRYLGDFAAQLPASALLFPLAISRDIGATEVVRTVLGVDEKAKSMTFAGDIPSGWRARLMRANFDRLVDGAVGAARASSLSGPEPAELALLVSCVGRKLVLKQRIEEELEGVETVLGSVPVFAGFYSYGEISPFTPSARCELHNQTMTITTLREA
jgi:hypothetical protein